VHYRLSLTSHVSSLLGL